MYKTKLKKGDTVLVISGKHKGQSGSVVSFIEKKKRGTNVMNTYVFVAGINLVNRATKGKGFVEKHLPLHISNVGYFDGSVVSRLGITRDGMKKVRVVKKTQNTL